MNTKNVILATIASATIATGINAAENNVVNKAWEGHKYDDLCYAITFPEKTKDANAEGNRYVTITNRPSEDRRNELAFVSGFPEDYQIDGSVSVDANLPFKLLTYKGVGFVKSGDIETMLASQMRAGSKLEVKWTNLDGEYIVDRYSLMGFTATHKFISKCK